MSHMRSLADAYVGCVIGGRYNVDRVLGCGGMGFVLAATHQLTGGRVALKIVPNAEDASLDRLLLEAKAPALVKHPNLVEVHDVGYDEVRKSYFLVQELLEGVDLRTHLDKRGRLPWREAVALLTPVMDALTAAHEAGVVHRDLKPENLFLSREHGGVVVPRVLDFGIARVTNKRERLTTVGSTLGTPWYMSPSSAKGESDVGPEGDVWSMGVIMFECISGVLPFDGDNYNAVMNAIVSTIAPRLDTVISDVPAAIVNVIAKSLEHDRARRFATMGEMMNALLDAARESSTSVRPAVQTHASPRVRPPQTQSTILPPPMPAHRVDWRPAAAAVGAFVLVLSALFGVRALATPRAPMVMRAISVRPSMVHSLTPAHAAEMAAVHPTVARDGVVRDARVRDARVIRRTPATRGRSPALASSPRPPSHVTARNSVARNGAPIFEP